MSWVSLNDVYVNKNGGTVNGNLAVNGSLTIDSAKGDGSTYNVANQITSLNSGKAALSHTHSAKNITSDVLDAARLPIIPVTKGGTGATTAQEALTNLGAASASALKSLQNSVSSNSGTKYLYGSASTDMVSYRKKGYLVEMKWDFSQTSTDGWDVPTYLPEGYRPVTNVAGTCVLGDAQSSPTNNVAYYEMRTSGKVHFSITVARSNGRNCGYCVFLAA